MYQGPMYDEYGIPDYGTDTIILTNEQLFGHPAMYPDGDPYEENWAAIDDGSRYWVSESGEIWSVKNQKRMKIGKNISNKCPAARLCFGKAPGVLCGLHRLLAEAFIPNPNNYTLVRHLDDNPENYDLENLDWGTFRDNWEDSVRNGTAKRLTKEDSERALLARQKPVKVIDKRTGEERLFSKLKDAADYVGYTSAYVCKCLKGGWDNKYYTFEYIPKEA